MNNRDCCLEIAGINIKYKLIYKNTAKFFRDFWGEKKAAVAEVGVTLEDLENEKGYFPEYVREELLEGNLLAGVTSDTLLSFQRCIFHGVSFLWRDKAYIFTAPSGTGKTTQYILWKLLYGEEILLMNGDKPILEVREDSEIWVHPSPWKGKEGMSNFVSAPLGGLIYLKQGERNEIREMSTKEAILPIFSQFLFSAKTEKSIHQVCYMEEKMLSRIPIWNLVNRGDKDSARLTHDTILQYEERKKDEKL